MAPATTETPAPPNPAVYAEVTYTGGLLQVRADNSSLNQILRSISHMTGLKITGGVEEQRVFGSYGPAPLSTVLSTLLDGTGSNILLLAGGAGAPPELVLTSRNGGPEPPGPNSPTYAMFDESNGRANSAAPAPVSPPVVAPASAGTPAAVVAPAPAGSKVLTPEMVEQELLQMQKKQKPDNGSKPQK
jgi:hypothetical protein